MPVRTSYESAPNSRQLASQRGKTHEQSPPLFVTSALQRRRLSIKSAPDWSGISGPGFFTRLQSGPGFWDFCNFRWHFFYPKAKKISAPSAPNSLSLPSGAAPKSGPGFLSSLQSGPGFWDIPDHLVRDFILREESFDLAVWIHRSMRSWLPYSPW